MWSETFQPEFRDKTTIDDVLEPPTPRALEGPTTPVSDRLTIARVEQLQELAARPVACERPSCQHALQVSPQHGAFAHGGHAALGAIPFAYVGGGLTLPGHWYRTLVGLVLWAAAVRLWLPVRAKTTAHAPRRLAAVFCGAGIGMLSGLTGTGGGIFLSPLLLFMGWAETRETAGVSAAFILANSAAALAGNPLSVSQLPTQLPLWAGAVVIGGFAGSELGSRRIGAPLFRRLLGLVLVIAGAKLIYS